MKPATLEDIKVGAKLKTYYSEDNPSNESFEISGIVDEMYVEDGEEVNKVGITL